MKPDNLDVVKQFVALRDAAFENENFEFFRAMPDAPKNDQVFKRAFHQARLEAATVSDAKRWKSVIWLRQNSPTRLGGFPLPTSIKDLPQ